jgi:hypothetical protein
MKDNKPILLEIECINLILSPKISECKINIIYEVQPDTSIELAIIVFSSATFQMCAAM